MPIGELHQGEVSEKEVKTYEPPKRAKRVYQSNAIDLLEDDEDLPSIKLIHTRNYTNVNKIMEYDQLTDDNWHMEREDEKSILQLWY